MLRYMVCFGMIFLLAASYRWMPVR